LNACEKIDNPLANAEFKTYRAINNGKPLENTLYYHYARLIELLSLWKEQRSCWTIPIFWAKTSSIITRNTRVKA
jgi:coenzyme F420-reducing hydrogenase alpha subunit